MTLKHELDDLFHPHVVAIIGATDRTDSVGHKVMSNMRQSQFEGRLIPINPKHQTVQGLPCFASVTDVTEKIDLAVIVTPAREVVAVLTACGEKGIRVAVIISAGFSEMGATGKVLENDVLKVAQQYGIRFIGPNCLGIMVPKSHMNATFDNNFALPGDIALLSQSGAICAAILDWSLEKTIGFSAIVSMGNSSDLDFGDMLTYLAQDASTKSILLYIEGVHYPRRFLDGLRAAARVKPVIAIKAGRNPSGVRAVHSHTGALVGADDVFSAALMRAGAVRVPNIQSLFTATKILSSHYRVSGNRLLIVTNGGGAGVIAADRASELNLTLPALGQQLLNKLNAILPAQWSHQNPIDILGDAPPSRYAQVLEACLAEDICDAILVILVPVAMSAPLEVAEQLCQFAKESHKPIIACWMGEKHTRSAWQLFARHQVPYFNTPEQAVDAFSYLVDYYHNQQILLQAPEPLVLSVAPDIAGAHDVVNAALAAGREVLTSVESKEILSAFDIPVSAVSLAATVDEAVRMAAALGYPVVMKISSPDITHKQDVEGVRLNLRHDQEVRSAFEYMMQQVKTRRPDATIEGVTLERMMLNANNRELMIGVARDNVFGPVISFGMGGSLVEVIRDRAVALPPLNHFLAQQLISRTRALKWLGAFRGQPPVNLDALIHVLLRVSDMIHALPQLVEMDINPLLASDRGVIAVDARIIVEKVVKE